MSKKKTQKISNMMFEIVLTLSLVIMVVAVTFSWYTIRKTTKLNEMKISTAVESGVHLVVNGTVYDEQYIFPMDVNLEPTFSDGITFFDPTEFDPNGRKVLTNGTISVFEPVATAFAEATDITTKQMTMDFGLLSQKQMKVIISPQSYVVQQNGDISSLALAGSVRMAFFYKNSTDEEFILKCVWIPNAKYELKDQNGFKVNQEGTPEESYTFMHSLDWETEVDTYKTPNGIYTDDDEVDYIWGEFPKDYEFCMVDDQMVSVKIVLWIDGNDRESVSSVYGQYVEKDGETVWQGGQIKTYVLFNVGE